MEEWRQVEINPIFEISNFGNLKRSLSPNTKNSTMYYKGDVGRQGYKRYNIFYRDDHSASYKKGKLNKSRFLAHRLVAEAFIPNPNKYPIINHIDGNPSNNHVSNLEWCTHGQNLKHAYFIGRASKVGEKNSIAKLSDKKVILIRSLYAKCKKPQSFIAKLFGVNQAHISMVVNRKIWTHV